MLPDADYLYACDAHWWEEYYADVKAGFRGDCFSIEDKNDGINAKPEYEIKRIPSRHGGDFGEDEIHDGVSGGPNSGFQACNLAYMLGAKTIMLLGMDMGGRHFFGDHPGRMNVASPYSGFMKSFASITKDVEIINCSRRTAMRCFPILRIQDALP